MVIFTLVEELRSLLLLVCGGPCMVVLGKLSDPGSGTANNVYCIENTNYEIKEIRMVDS